MLAWGHTKSACSVVAKILRSRPVHVTLFTPLVFIEKAESTLNGLFLPGIESEDKLRMLIRVVGLECGPSPLDSSLLVNSFLFEYTKLTQLGNEDKAGPPKLVLLDPPLYQALTGIRAISRQNVPIYMLQSAVVAAILVHYGPESMGGAGDLHAKFKKNEWPTSQCSWTASDV